MATYLCQKIRRSGDWTDSFELCVMTYDERFLRRKVVQTVHRESILVDLEQALSLDHGDAFELSDGRLIEVIAAEEELLQITGDDLVRLAWHIGNRHTPCQIETHRLVIQRNSVLADMLAQLGAQVIEIVEPFNPEGGAYGHGRTHGHQH